MRPTKLIIQGLTAYKQQVEIDFTELDLFAITGPTGAGKSSLVDAITFALFGQAPRVGRSVKELISQGEDRLKVSLEFSSDGSRYRIHRSTARKGQAPVQLERWDAGDNDWTRITDRATDATREIEEALRMDYDAFVRSVLLPQGQFQEFLSGDRDERRKVLDGLLQLGVYAHMQQRANAIAARAGEDAGRIHERLETELREATPEALKDARQRLAELDKSVAELAKTREAIDAACRMADALTDARAREDAARKKLDEAGDQLAKSKTLAAGGTAALKKFDDQITDVQAEMKAAPYDNDLHMKLVRCVEPMKALGELSARGDRLAEEIKASTAAARKLTAAEAQAKARHEEARRAAEAAQKAFDDVRHGNAAALLQSNLKSGDPCPVCGQKVGHVAAGATVDRKAFDKARTNAEAASAAAEKANAVMQEATIAVSRSQQHSEGLQSQADGVRGDHEKRSAEVHALLPEAGLTAARAEEMIAALETAKTRVATLEQKQKDLKTEREREAKAIEGALDDVRGLEVVIKTLLAETVAAQSQVADLQKGLRDAAAQMAWDDEAIGLESGRDVALLLRKRFETAQVDESRANQEIGAQGTRIKQIDANIKLAKELRAKEKEHRDAAVLSRDLASLLKTDRFPTFIRERALQTLAREGSRQLEEISGGRYDFEVEGQDFLIVDRWNGGETRSVKTLSGGETFLASLALALALAEHLPSLATSGGESALESLFIDEGFSHLDAETLNTVASALEVLGQDRRRLIGVVTHVPALAERMPARIIVHKSQAGSTVSVE